MSKEENIVVEVAVRRMVGHGQRQQKDACWRDTVVKEERRQSRW